MTKLDPPAWMQSTETKAVLAALRSGGAEVRFVGGAVRDTLLARPVTDIDLATPEPPETVMQRLTEAGLRAIPTGLSHGTVTALSGGRQYEITTLRRDVETDGRRAVVAFTDDWAEDAARRDFTMNALYLDGNGVLFDPTGGYADVLAGRVRFVGDAEARIKEDALRLLRFFRFQAHYGRSDADPVALAACARCAADLDTLSGERLWLETSRLLLAENPIPTLRLMAKAGILTHLPGPMMAIDALDRLLKIESGQYASGTLRRLACLIPLNSAAAVAGRFRLSNAERETLTVLTGTKFRQWARPDRKIWKEQSYRLGPALACDLFLLAWVDASGAPEEARNWASTLDFLKGWSPPLFPLRGEDLLQEGASPGPAIGQILRHLEEGWIAGDFAEGREGLLKKAKSQM